MMEREWATGILYSHASPAITKRLALQYHDVYAGRLEHVALAERSTTNVRTQVDCLGQWWFGTLHIRMDARHL